MAADAVTSEDLATGETYEQRGSPGSVVEKVRVPFNRPAMGPAELAAACASMDSGVTACDGPLSRLAADALRTAIGAVDVLLTTSCTAALELSAMLIDVKPGDVVIVPSFTFATTASAYARHGAQLLFCDIDEATLGMDPHHLERLLDRDVRAVVPVHYAGISCDIDGILDVIAAYPNISLVEDNAHGLFATHGPRPLGSFGRFSTLSFHETKNFTCGEGGALIVNDVGDVDRARTLYHKGTNREAFLRGDVAKYSWVDIGSSFGLADILAGVLLSQLQRRDEILAKRRQVFDAYIARLHPLVERYGIRLPVVPTGSQQAYHMMYLIMPDGPTREKVRGDLAAEGISAYFHYAPLHLSEAGRRHQAAATDCPVTETISGCLLRLPFHTALTESQIDMVTGAVEASLSGQSGQPPHR